MPLIAFAVGIMFLLAQAFAQTPNATCNLTFNNNYTASTNANAGTASVTGSDPNGFTSITISQDGNTINTCNSGTCSANTSWTSNNTPHVISAICLSASQLKQNVSVTYPN